MITMAAMKAGFSGGLVVDYPNSTRAKKFFLTLMAGPPMEVPKAKGLDGSDDDMDDDDEGIQTGSRAQVRCTPTQ